MEMPARSIDFTVSCALSTSQRQAASRHSPMPAHDRGGHHNLHGPAPVRPDAREQYPEQAIEGTDTRSFRRSALQYGELMPERENFCCEVEPGANRGVKRAQQGDEQGSHLAETGTRLRPATTPATTRTEYSVD